MWSPSHSSACETWKPSLSVRPGGGTWAGNDDQVVPGATDPPGSNVRVGQPQGVEGSRDCYRACECHRRPRRWSLGVVHLSNVSSGGGMGMAVRLTACD